jgi:hypothetical protein
MFLNGLKELEGRYGTRSNAAAKEGIDVKSLMHAYRLLFEAEEFLITGSISLPLKKEDIEFLTEIRLRNPNILAMDHFKLITEKIDYLENKKVPLSPLPKSPNHKKINKFCMEMTEKHLNFWL